MDSDRHTSINFSATKQEYLKHSIYSSPSSALNTQIGNNIAIVDVPQLIPLNSCSSEKITSNNHKPSFNFQQIGKFTCTTVLICNFFVKSYEINFNMKFVVKPINFVR